jgi:hypothetical protein
MKTTLKTAIFGLGLITVNICAATSISNAGSAISSKIKLTADTVKKVKSERSAIQKQESKQYPEVKLNPPAGKSQEVKKYPEVKLRPPANKKQENKKIYPEVKLTPPADKKN